MLGVIGAMAAGVVIGLLVAPQKGKKLRKRIREVATDWMDEVKSVLPSRETEDVEEKSANVNLGI